MDTESYETFECDYPLDEEDTVNFEKLNQLVENKDLMSTTQIEYWDVMGRKFLTRVLLEK